MSFWARDHVIWKDGTFVETWMEERWGQLPQSLRDVVLRECAAGNKATHIQGNSEKNVVVLSLEGPPVYSEVPSDVIVHTGFSVGNYRYDNVECTYQDRLFGSLVAFMKKNP